MAQNQRSNQRPNQHRTKPSEDRQGADKDRHATPQNDDIHEQGEYKDQHVPLRDPSEGRSPAVIGQDVANWGDQNDYQNEAAAQPQPPVIGVEGYPIEDGERDPGTIAEEQRRRSEEMQEQGANWMASRDSRTEEQRRDSEFQGSVIASGGGRFDQERDRYLEGDNLARRS